MKILSGCWVCEPGWRSEQVRLAAHRGLFVKHQKIISALCGVFLKHPVLHDQVGPSAWLDQAEQAAPPRGGRTLGASPFLLTSLVEQPGGRDGAGVAVAGVVVVVHIEVNNDEILRWRHVEALGHQAALPHIPVGLEVTVLNAGRRGGENEEGHGENFAKH